MFPGCEFRSERRSLSGLTGSTSETVPKCRFPGAARNAGGRIYRAASSTPICRAAHARTGAARAAAATRCSRKVPAALRADIERLRGAVELVDQLATASVFIPKDPESIAGERKKGGGINPPPEVAAVTRLCCPRRAGCGSRPPSLRRSTPRSGCAPGRPAWRGREGC